MKETQMKRTSVKVVVLFTGLFLALPVISTNSANRGQGNIEKEWVSSVEVMATPLGWSDDLRLTYTLNYSRSPDIVVDQDNIYVVWKDYRSGSYEVFFKKSEDGGQTWSEDLEVSTITPSPFCEPKIAINGSHIHVVWEGWDVTREVHYRNSTNGGETWNPEVRLTEDDGNWSMHPHIAVSGSNIHIMWTDEKNGGIQDVYYRSSNNGGQNWNSEQRLTNYPDHEGGICIASNGSLIHIVWSRWLIKPEVFYMNSTDGGLTWNPELQLTPDNGIGTNPNSLAIWQNDVHLVYTEQDEVYYMNSTNGGITWSPSKRISDLGNFSQEPDVAAMGNDVIIVWMDDKDHYGYVGSPWGPCEIYFSNSTDGGISWSSNQRLTYAKNQSIYPEIALSNENIHLIWEDNRTGTNQDFEIYYKRYPDFPDHTFNITLDEGWNLVSLPFEQRDESIDQALSSIAGKWDCIRTYDSLSPEPWKTNITGRPNQLNDFDTLNHKQGFWINITEPGGTILTCSGYDPPSSSINLYAGWNLIGYPSEVNETVANALWGTGADKVMVCDTSKPYHIKEVGPTYIMRAGEGYWIHVPADTVWTIDW